MKEMYNEIKQQIKSRIKFDPPHLLRKDKNTIRALYGNKAGVYRYILYGIVIYIGQSQGNIYLRGRSFIRCIIKLLSGTTDVSESHSPKFLKKGYTENDLDNVIVEYMITPSAMSHLTENILLDLHYEEYGCYPILNTITS
jgi:hypothetical protein